PHKEQRCDHGQRPRVVLRLCDGTLCRAGSSRNFWGCHFPSSNFAVRRIPKPQGAISVVLSPSRRFRDPLLPPGLRLQPVREPAGSVLEWGSAHETAEAVRPTGIRQKCPQDGAAEELATGSDLRCDRELAEPAIDLAIAVLRRNKTVGVVKPSLKS